MVSDITIDDEIIFNLLKKVDDREREITISDEALDLISKNIEEFTNINDALISEKKIKGWVRKKKIDLINSKNPEWNNLAESKWDPSLRSG